MVNNPKKFIPWYANAGADIITFHIEASDAPINEIKLIKSMGIKAGLSIKPETSIEKIIPFLDEIDMVLVMSVSPGFGGQPFNDIAIDKISQLNHLKENKSFVIEVDGGINPNTAKKCIEVGADILVAGTSVFENGKYKENIKKLKGE
jgi:ribulose-phosphate 3-epimerase